MIAALDSFQILLKLYNKTRDLITISFQLYKKKKYLLLSLLFKKKEQHTIIYHKNKDFFNIFNNITYDSVY